MLGNAFWFEFSGFWKKNYGYTYEHSQFNYYVTLEKELHEICSWISLQKQFIIIMGDMNLNKLSPGDKEGKILCDLEEVYGLECLIN